MRWVVVAVLAGIVVAAAIALYRTPAMALVLSQTRYCT